MKPFILSIAFAALVTSCAPTSTSKPLYYWGDYSKYSNKAIKKNTQEDTANLLKVYEEIMANETKGSRGIPPPGICADYGYFLMSNGEFEKGKELLNKEISLYPESKIFIERILKIAESTK